MATVNFISYSHQSRAVLSRVTAYVMQGQKTAEGEWVSGQNCLPQLAAREFTATREAYRKDSPVWFYHYTQSFHPREPVTPALAHRIAKEFASQAWPDSEVLIATHVDAVHIHSHFLVNAVCHESGKMLRQGPNTLRQLRQLSDGLCMKYGLSVLPQKQKQTAQGMGTREYRSAERGQSWKFRLMNTIDDCMCYAKTKAEFMTLMKSEGYDIRWTGSRKNITYTTPDGNKCRDSKLHDNKYLKEAMELEFAIRAELISGRIEAKKPYNERSAVRRLGSADEYTLGHQQPAGGAEPLAESAASQSVEFTDADAGNFSDPDLLAAGTGWEEEREICLAMALAPAGHSSGLGMAASPSDSHSLVGDLLQLGRSLERAGDSSPVKDSTTMPAHHESKQRRQEKEKKIALGHRPDDHEETFTYSMPTM